ncbi:MAG TPA: aldo/keto reductase [Anaerolineales bacterium]|nr:aldo/keto reductase [Anaerolineales bacterium]
MVSNETRFLHAIEMGLGAWQWGDRFVWQYGQGFDDEDIHQVFLTSIAEGIRFLDTAEVYGSGRSERMTGKFLKETDQPVLVATKFFPLPWRLTSDSVPAALKRSLERLQMETVDLYQVHMPSPLFSPETAMEGMIKCVNQGWTRTVGVSNYNQSQMIRAYSTLERNSISLASNQVHFSLLNREVEKNGLLARCKELGVRLIAYSPLEMGLLTGKYTSKNPPPGNRGGRYANLLNKIEPLLKLMNEVGQEHGGKSNPQVALNWVICKGALPIPGAKKASQALQNAGALGWKLSEEEVARLDEASDRVLQ